MAFSVEAWNISWFTPHGVVKARACLPTSLLSTGIPFSSACAATRFASGSREYTTRAGRSSVKVGTRMMGEDTPHVLIGFLA